PGHAREKVGEILAPREVLCRTVDQWDGPDDRSDHALDDPLSPKFGAPRTIVFHECVIRPSWGHRPERRFDEVREQLTAAERRVHAFTGERVKEIGGVADEGGARMPRSTRMRGERTGRNHRRRSFSIREPRGEMATLAKPAVDECGPITRRLPRATGGHN